MEKRAECSFFVCGNGESWCGVEWSGHVIRQQTPEKSSQCGNDQSVNVPKMPQ